MSRRSTRLLSGGYYHSDEESDSSSVTTISYREIPVKVFKKKGGGRKRRSGEESPSSSIGGAETTLGAPSSGWSTVPRPALRSPDSPSSSPSLPLPPSPSRRPVLHSPAEVAPSAVDSSGYSSAEDPCKRPSSSSEPASTAGTRAVPREWLRGAVSRLKDAVIPAVTIAVGAVQSRVVQLAQSRSLLTPPASVTGNSSSSARMKRLLCGLLLLLLLIGVWWSSLLSALSIRTDPALTAPAHSPDPPLTTLDAATVSAAAEAKMQRIQKEMQLRQDRLLTELKQQMQLDIQALTHKSHKQDNQLRMEAQVEQRLGEVQSTLQMLRAQSESTTASLLLRISALEDQLFQMEQRVDPLPTPQLTPELEQTLGTWLTLRLQEQAAAQAGSCVTCDRPLADRMADFALESQGASVISTRCSETYRTRSACVTLFGLPLWYPSESPRTVIQGPAVLLPGKCWAFHGVQGTLVIALSHPIRISHVTLDHLPRHSSPSGRIQSAPKDFQVYGMTNETEKGTLLGTFRYQEDGEPTQTFSLSGLTDAVYHVVELRVLSNWGHVQYTCVYRFRVHGKMASTDDL